MPILGEIEEFISEELYPYRWPILIGLALVFAASAWVAFRMNWHKPLLRNPLLSAAVAVALITVFAYPVYYLGSPLFDSGRTVCEVSPIAGAGAGSERCAAVAEGATSEAVEPTVVPSADPAAGQTAAPAQTETAAAFTAQTIAEGTFEGADDFHFGRGQALLIEDAPGDYVLRFENFEVRNGPDLFVYLSTEPDGYSDDGLELGELKGTKGAFNYDVPAGSDVVPYESVVIWCKDFSVLFATATLTR